MPQETELKLALHPKDAARLLAHPLLGGLPRAGQRLFNTYFDTPDLALREARLALRERRVGARRWLTVKTSGSTVGGLSRRGEWEVPKPRGRVDFARVVDEPALAAALQDWAPRLRAVFRTDFVRRAVVVEHAGARIELAVDDGHISVGSGRRARRERLLEVELELLDGPVDALFDLAHTLALGPEGQAARALRLHPEPRSKAERGYALFAGQAAMPRRATPLALARGMAVREAFQAASLACLTHLQANEAEPRALADLPLAGAPLPDPEFVHQLRVALRRLRTGLRLFREHLPRRWVAHWSAHWKGLADALGAARNWDVFATEWLPDRLPDSDTRAEAQALRAWVDAQRRAANLAVARRLADPAHALALLAFTRSVFALPVPRARVNLPRWAVARLRAGHARLREQARDARRLGPDGRHELRLALKKLRYTQEFLIGLLDPQRAARSTATLAEAQALLGELNDLATAQGLLQQVPARVAPALVAALQSGLQAQLEAGLLALPAMESALERSPPPW